MPEGDLGQHALRVVASSGWPPLWLVEHNEGQSSPPIGASHGGSGARQCRDGVTIVGVELAKRSFQFHDVQADGSIAFRRKLSREKLLDFLASRPR